MQKPARWKRAVPDDSVLGFQGNDPHELVAAAVLVRTMKFAVFPSLVRVFLISGMLAGSAVTQAADPAPASAPLPQDWQVLAAERARLLSRVKWTPVAETMPNRSGGFFEKGREYTGVPYSSVKSVGRYIGFDVGLRTFLAAVENPRSVLYTETLAGKTANAAGFYGAVCSSYTSYALQCGLPEVSRRYGPGVSQGIVLVSPQSAQAAQVGDVIYTPHETETSGSHVELVTAVTRDAAGRVATVLVEESRPPTTRVTERRAEAFDAHLATRNKQLFRVTDLNTWRGANRAETLGFPNYEMDAKAPVVNRTLLLDLGDRVPYQKGQPVKMNVMDRDALGVKTLVIRCGGEVVEEVPLKGAGVVERTFTRCGDYTAQVVRPDGSVSQACEFAVCDLELKLPESGRVSMSEAWPVRFGSTNLKVIAVYLSNEADTYGRHSHFVTEEQRRQGALVVPAGLLKKPGKIQVWLIGEHGLGRLKVRRDVVGEGARAVSGKW
ncbi:hypothetical protein [Verrucomicrobium sp. BvORR106]|uniref:hypothetical protein n=1 Tax=Verrucomicrobium sp. BvORR106 TaxID=1403819 RepID=UPI002241014F|nr:hypothetical protein [Verrucomicrobium sp. BvORR106]